MSDMITGVVEAVIYQSPDGAYTVCELEAASGEPITVVGALPMVAEGIRIRAFGEWGNHPTYGKQFKCEYYEEELPDNEGDILRYLSAGNIKGIGPKTAMRIVERYGTETFDVLENHPEWLAEISSISKSKAAAIGEDFRENAGARAVIMYCRNICSPNMSMKIYKKWGSAAVNRIEQNPYVLCKSISGIGFRKADELAKSIGIPSDSPNRIEAGLIYILEEEARRGGHTCLPLELLISYAADLLCIDAERIAAAADELTERKRLINVSSDIFIPKYYDAECRIARKLAELSVMCPRISGEDIGQFIFKTEQTGGIEFASNQKKAIAAALEHGVVVITGGPGTGKTTVTKALIGIFESMGLRCALAAPTGRAANRMSEATSHEAQTIHRLLETGFSPDSDDEDHSTFIRNENNPLVEDVLILDEVSMVDTLLMDSFLKAVKNGARVILIGDSDQLPSVGAGNILGDIIASECFCTVRLTDIFRQADSSMIVTNAHAVNSGELPVSGGKDSDFFVLKRSTDAEVAATVTDLCVRRLPMAYGADITEQLQIISPSKKGAAGTEEICRVMQSVLNPADVTKHETVRGGVVFREGDRVMQIRNNYLIEWEKDGSSGMGIFNGDIGVIESIDPSDGTVTVNFDGKRAEYGSAELDELELSYAITVHKSQGSEYPAVVIPVYGCHPFLLNRCLLYTAITRAARLCVIVARGDSLEQTVKNDSHIVRRTGLIKKLTEYFESEARAK